MGEKKIIKYRATCKDCGSVIEAEEGELTIQQCPRESYSFSHARCLVCKGSIVFYKSKGE